MIRTIVSVDLDWGIGKDNQLLLRIPDDLKRFKKITQFKTVIMGRKTFESIGRPLINRKNIILTNSDFKYDDDNVIIYNNINDIINDIRKSRKEAYVIGGQSLYEQMLEYSDFIYVTQIHERFYADRFFPDLNKMDDFRLISASHNYEYNSIPYTFLIYERVRSKHPIYKKIRSV